MILPLRGHHIADIGDNRYSYPSTTLLSFHLRRCNDLVFYTAGHLGTDRVSRCYENELFRKHRKPEPTRPLFHWKHSSVIEGISNVNQTD